jgi:hypothetical protein
MRSHTLQENMEKINSFVGDSSAALRRLKVSVSNPGMVQGANMGARK